MALDVDLVAAAGVVLAAEEVVEADLVEPGRGLVGRDVAADLEALAVGAETITAAFQRIERADLGARCPRRRGTTARAPAGSC